MEFRRSGDLYVPKQKGLWCPSYGSHIPKLPDVGRLPVSPMECAVSGHSYGASTTDAVRASTVITAPASITNGDLLIIFFHIANTSSPTATPPSGFTVIPGFPLSVQKPADPYYISVYAWSKIASSESGNYTVTHSNLRTQGFCAAYSGENTTTPLSPTATTNTGTGATSTALGLTAVANGLVIYFGDDWGDKTAGLTPPTGTTPTFTERQDASASGTMYMADGAFAAGGATGNKTQTNNCNAGNPWCASLIAIQPAAASGGGPLTHGGSLTHGSLIRGGRVAA